MKEVRDSPESKGKGRRRQNGAAPKGACCRVFSLISILKEGIKVTGAGGLTKLPRSMERKCGSSRYTTLRK
jgi:hypothetical protein